jgi:hypothetical protein
MAARRSQRTTRRGQRQRYQGGAGQRLENGRHGTAPRARRLSRPKARRFDFRCGAGHPSFVLRKSQRLIAGRIWRAAAITKTTRRRRHNATTESTKSDVEKWLAIRKEAGSSSIQKRLSLIGRMRRHSIHTASTPIFRRNFSRLGGNTSLILPEATCGCGLATCPKLPETRCGRSINRSWHFQQDLKTFPGEALDWSG